MIGFIPVKIAGSSTRAIATILIPEDAMTNVNRSNIVNKDTAKYRTDKLLTISIILPDGSICEKAETIYEEYPFRFIVNKYTVDTHYNHNILVETCLSGLHFFLDKSVALLYGIVKVQGGSYKEWYSNGQIKRLGEFKHSKPSGEWYTFYPTGILQSYTKYDNGKQEGLFKYWYDSSILCTQIEYASGELNGTLIRWNQNETIMYTEKYMKGKLVV